MHYVYRATTEKLPDGLDRIFEAGDTVLALTFVGGRDWIVVCRRAGSDV